MSKKRSSWFATHLGETLSYLTANLASSTLIETNVIPWGCPVPSFGDISGSVIATLGINPSNREFVDESGNELDGPLRRLPTLKSLGLSSWAESTSTHNELILNAGCNYFHKNPYNAWFETLEKILSGANASYYDNSLFKSSFRACHLDLIPYATACKWTDLSSTQKALLLQISGSTLGLLLRHSQIRLLILNGRTVVESLQKITSIEFDRQEMAGWELPRMSKESVRGYSYFGRVSEISGIELAQPVTVIGFNHNLQSSFGVTSKVRLHIREWVAEVAKDIFT
jgi:hypothetical protein